jgi:beta-lactam-binding protein with PASTA domain
MRSTFLLIALIAAPAFAGCHEDRSIVVPNLVGLPQPEAQKQLERLGLRWRFGGSDQIASKAPKPLPPDTFITPDPYQDPVVSQMPPPGDRVAKGDLVELETRCTMLRFENSACL